MVGSKFLKTNILYKKETVPFIQNTIPLLTLNYRHNRFLAIPSKLRVILLHNHEK